MMQKTPKNDSTALELTKLITCDKLLLTINIKYFKKCTDYTELIKYIMGYMAQYKVYGDTTNLENFVDLKIDFDGLKTNNIDTEFLKMLFPFLEDNYPNTINKILCVNVPTLIKMLIKIMKRFMAKDTQKKIVIIKTNAKGENETLTSDEVTSLFNEADNE
tara:strand:+ start:3335 stop:3817 length:483 start_codon:yes stop_codon:yes gene_type:complete